MELHDLEERIWFADTEVFAYDNIWVFTRYGTGETVTFVNDNGGVLDFIGSEHPIICGYNFRDYDQYILKGVLCDMTVVDLKNINDLLIGRPDDMFDQLFAFFDGFYPKVKMPPIIDLFHDIVPRRSLKVIEGNLGMSVKESDVPFDIDRPLTDEELEESVEYCKYDVYATSVLYEHRREYLQSKITLAEICDEDVLPLLKHSNARILAEVFHAEPYAYDPKERYEIPKEIDLSGIPQEVMDYVAKIDCSVATRETDLGKLEFDFHGVPSIFGIGGIHSADEVPYVEETTDERVLLIQDITSYYPSIILEYGYVSRAIAPHCMDMYGDFYQKRVEAKASGDKLTANAAKLVLNTFSGAMGAKHNKMYDPMMPLAMRITGQLAIMDAVNCAMRNAPSARFIQLNTDGWVLSVNRDELQAVLDGVSEWERRTRFSVDTQHIKRLIQRDVNNYILETTDGKVKVKGGTVSQFGGTTFTTNTLAITHEAIVNKLLYGKPVRSTVWECDDLSKFQIVAKAGSTFDHTEWLTSVLPNGVCRVHRLNMCNRIFATNDQSYGMVYKVKDGKRAKVPNCPEHAMVVNGKLDTDVVPDWLDREWYVRYSEDKLRAFVKGAIGFDGKEIRMEETQAEAPKRKTSGTRKTTKKNYASFAEMILDKQPENLNEAMFKLQVLMSANSGSVKFDGYIDNINYSYADTQQYKTLLSRTATECGLYVTMSNTYNNSADYRTEYVQNYQQIDEALNGPIDNDTPKRKKFVVAHVSLELTFTFFMTGESVTFCTTGMGVGMQGNALPIAYTNAFRNFITNNFLLDNKGRDGDDVAANFTEGLVGKAEKAYVSQSEKSEMVASITGSQSGDAKYATVTYAKALYPKLVKAAEMDGAFALKVNDVIDKAFLPNGEPICREGDTDHSILKRAGASKLMREAESVIDA